MWASLGALSNPNRAFLRRTTATVLSFTALARFEGISQPDCCSPVVWLPTLRPSDHSVSMNLAGYECSPM
ncbi:hypothetical protein M407DRAFT_243199 [Tulasnella calospora MUT 4182]|uniref:Uncharacterized protein n=1 Tax=Tulasnella calospora MUT 4182 TaxID=1051891 RepID=A0A0C3QBL7_9AGAM|nr:hypothetical protein M407DRAFT_243199 [Tulasnella calospora MUT 4182]